MPSLLRTQAEEKNCVLCRNRGGWWPKAEFCCQDGRVRNGISDGSKEGAGPAWAGQKGLAGLSLHLCFQELATLNLVIAQEMYLLLI